MTEYARYTMGSHRHRLCFRRVHRIERRNGLWDAQLHVSTAWLPKHTFSVKDKHPWTERRFSLQTICIS